VYVHLSRSTVFGSVILVALIASAAWVVAQFPTLSVGNVTVQTPVLIGLLSGILLVPSILSQYRSGETRESIRWALFAVGIPLSLTRQSPFDWIGVLAVLVSLAVAWELDRRLFGPTPQ
jgi:hypothetical protein